LSLLGYVVLLYSWNECFVCVLHRQCYYFVCLNDKIEPHIFIAYLCIYSFFIFW